METKNLIVLSLLLFAVLFSGCISISVDQAVSPDGTSSVTQKVDMSGFIAYMENLQKTYNTSNGSTDDSVLKMKESFSQVCVNATRDDPAITCSYDGSGTITLSKNITPAIGGYNFSSSGDFFTTTYVFETDTLPKINTEFGNSPAGSMQMGLDNESVSFTDPEAKSSAASLNMISAKMAYTISMPGEIEIAENGEIKDNRAVYDVISLMEEGQTVRVVSKVSSDVPYFIGAGIVILILIVVAVIVLKR